MLYMYHCQYVLTLVISINDTPMYSFYDLEFIFYYANISFLQYFYYVNMRNILHYIVWYYF